MPWRSPSDLMVSDAVLLAMLAAASDTHKNSFLEFFVSRIRNPNTRRAYGRTVGDFLTWCSDAGVVSIANVQPLYVAAWVEMLTNSHSPPTASPAIGKKVRIFIGA